MTTSKFNPRLASGYKSPSQRIRVMSEGWVIENIFCPACGKYALRNYPNNQPVADFYCDKCREDFELKSKSERFGAVITDGAYKTMIRRIESPKSPNLLLLTYASKALEVINVSAVPSHFFTRFIVEKRPPLKPNAKRAKWVGCNIRISAIPNTGLIMLVQSGKIQSSVTVLEKWKSVLFLRNQVSGNRGWTLSVMKCIEEIGRPEFTLADVYQFEEKLTKLHPDNRNIRPKIRQQLQVLRDRGYLSFKGNGEYTLKMVSNVSNGIF